MCKHTCIHTHTDWQKYKSLYVWKEAVKGEFPLNGVFVVSVRVQSQMMILYEYVMKMVFLAMGE